ncbi:MAG: carboxypeptidase regulatory-like domain-containing protein [Chloroflexi bacterium]|nr:carboxypeptidase regulatory-like domain-containing protein [Chloroflexota bacterium]
MRSGRVLPLVALALVPALLAACGEDGPRLPFVPTPSPTAEQPREVALLVITGGSREAIVGATVSAGATSVTTGEGGTATVTAMRGATIDVSAAEHDPAEATVPDEGRLIIELRSNVVDGTVTDPAGEPIAGVRVFIDGAEPLAETDEAGAYRLTGVPEEGTLIFKMPGYRLGEIQIDGAATVDLAMEPFEARALYAPSAVFEAPGRLDEMLALLDRTEANALVIDVKETDGRLYYSTNLETAAEVGAIRETPVFDLEELLPMLKERGIYTIARMVVMKDNTSAVARPEMAVRNSETGEPWRDNIGGAWLDPSAPDVAEYIASIAGDLAAKGFDEVQLDYIRFYSDGPYAVADTNLPNTQSFRLPAIGRVLRVVSEELDATRTFLGADVFPISFIVPDDQGIGQRPEVIMPFVDYFCPMVYPSHYGPGIFGFSVPNEFPYEVIDQTLEIMNEQREGLPVVIRPWIQDFGYGPFPPYTAAQVQAEFAAAADNDAGGWMIWNARATFTEAALGAPREGEDAGPTTTAQPATSASPDESAAPSASP